MTQSLTTKIAGLYTFQNDLSAVPEGALSQADNIFIDRDGEAEPRRGLDYMTHAGVQSAFSDPTYRANRLLFYQGQTLCHYDTSLLAYHNATTGWANYTGTFSPPSATVKVRSAQANQNFYLTTASGVMKLDSYTGTPGAIGVPPGLDATASLAVGVSPTGTTVNTSKVISSLSSSAGLAIGQSITGTGIPSNTIITSFTSTTLTLSNAATASNSGVTLTISAPSTWLAIGSGACTTAYRVLWGVKDANNNLIFGAPSQRSEITNVTALPAAVIVNFTVPPGITTAHFYQIYRAAAVATGIEPNDELGLVYEGNPLTADISAGSISVLDIVPDALRGATIYTAQSQEGLANSNEPPPLALDLAVFRNCLFYGNTVGLQGYNLTLLGTGTPTGIQSGDTITIGGIAYTAASSEVAASGQFAVAAVFSLTTTGTTSNGSTSLSSVGTTTGIAPGQTITGVNIPTGTFVVSIISSTVTMSQAATGTNSGVTFIGDSAGQAIRDTALSLVRVINRYASSTVYAYYESGPTDLPGKILFQARTVGAAAFPVVSSRSTCWNPALPTSGTTQSSTNDAFKNAIFYSKVSQPEAVPLGNFIFIGSADKNILRIIALRDSLFVLKEDGIFRVYGTDPSNFQVSPLDYTAILIAPDSAVAINNQIYALTTQGVVAIGEQGVQIMSHPIESDLTSLFAANYSLLQTSSFGVSYESDRAYYLFCIANAADTGPTQYYRYNYITNAWVRGTLAKTCGAVNPQDNKLYLGNSGLNIVDIERKTLTYADYADYASTQTISAVSGLVVTISSSDTIVVGSVISQSATLFGTVASIDPIGGTVTMTLATAFNLAAADVLAPIATAITWIPVAFANPGMSKQLREVSLLFRSDFNGTAQVGFSSDINPGALYESIAGGAVGGWGEFAWGGPFETPLGAPWGGNNRRRPIRVAVPRNHQRSSLLTVSFAHAYGFSPWLLQGISLIGNIVSERVAN